MRRLILACCMTGAAFAMSGCAALSTVSTGLEALGKVACDHPVETRAALAIIWKKSESESDPVKREVAQSGVRIALAQLDKCPAQE